MAVSLQIPGMGGSIGPLGPLALVVVCAVVGWLVYRDAKTHDVGYAWQAGVGVAALIFAGLIPGVLALVVYFLFIRR